MTRELPILFSGPMVRATLAGRKTQTRRVVKPQPPLDDDTECEGGRDEEEGWYERSRCPYGAPGDALYVREAFGESAALTGGIVYRADEPEGFYRWRPSIHMPKCVARLWLRVEDVRVERLQEISEEDAKAEGVDPLIPGHGPVTLEELRSDPGMWTPRMYRDGFSHAWSCMHDKPADFGNSWRESPWVWVVAFSRLPERDEWEAPTP